MRNIEQPPQAKPAAKPVKPAACRMCEDQGFVELEVEVAKYRKDGKVGTAWIPTPEYYAECTAPCPMKCAAVEDYMIERRWGQDVLEQRRGVPAA